MSLDQLQDFGFERMKDRVTKTAAGHSILIRGVVKLKIIFHPGGKAVPVTLYDVFVEVSVDRVF